MTTENLEHSGETTWTRVQEWTAVEDEIHDRPTHFDADGARVGETPNCVAVVRYPYRAHEGRCRIAHLLAAAPALFEALRGLTAIAAIYEAGYVLQGDEDEMTARITEARAALSAARGES